MSISIIILKPIEGFQYTDVLHSVRQAAGSAGMHCIHVHTCFDETGAFETLDGALSEVDAETLKSNFERGIQNRTYGFNIERPTGTSYGSFAWLIHKNNYFWAFDLQYLHGNFEFAFRFLSQYFNLEENSRDYLWIDDTDWVYSAEDMVWLSRRPYNPEWTYKKLTAATENT
ncbi:hypothetical protein [Flintibacter muris]|uniref:hypothetical protein n=1 Tax=Flintibacter muris TaxID=2941327 RepID=UPI00204219A5|nr:hypothetical protein [Flintibacter muris]